MSKAKELLEIVEEDQEQAKIKADLKKVSDQWSKAMNAKNFNQAKIMKLATRMKDLSALLK